MTLLFKFIDDWDINLTPIFIVWLFVMWWLIFNPYYDKSFNERVIIPIKSLPKILRFKIVEYSLSISLFNIFLPRLMVRMRIWRFKFYNSNFKEI